MNLSALCIQRPVAVTLLTVGIILAGAFAYLKLPVSPLPQVDYPTISVTASLPGASPDTVATSVAAPLERYLGRIADVTEMTSRSTTGQARITLQFDLERDIDGAARDVQAAINAAEADVSTSLTSNPTYRKLNPSDAPVLILALTSKTLTRGQLYDAASNVLEQRLSQIDGVGQVVIGGATLPAVRVELNPGVMFKYGIGLEDVRAALASANANSPKGTIDDGQQRLQLYTNDQADHAADYRPLVVAYRNNAAVRLGDVAAVEDSVQDLRNEGLANGQPSILVIVYRQPGANIIDTVERLTQELPQLKAAMPSDVEITLASDRSTTIRASLRDTRWTLVFAVILVTLVVFATLSDPRAALIPAVVVPVSVIGTFAGMYLLGFSLDNLSLMALTIATGFVVDDAIVVLENISRHVESGMPRAEAARRGAREIGFTVISISISLVAVFLPILLMGGIVGRLFREFTLTLTLAIILSMVISLTTTPMMCAILLRPAPPQTRPSRRRALFERVTQGYEHSLRWALDHRITVTLVLLATIGLNVFLFTFIPKGFFPQEDTGMLQGGIVADQSISFQRMRGKLKELMDIVGGDPAVQSVAGYTGSGSGGGGGAAQTNTGTVYVRLKPLSERGLTSDDVIARLRGKLSRVAGGRLFLQTVQDLRVGARQSNAEYQYTLLGDDSKEIYEWTPKLLEALQHNPDLVDVNSDQQEKGLETDLVIDRDSAARLGLTPSQVDNTLYDAFGQRQVSTIYSALNQYHVVMEVAPRYWQDPATLSDIFVSTSGSSPTETATTNAIQGTITAQATPGGAATGTTTATASSSSQNLLTNAIANSGRGVTSSGAAVSTALETMVPLAALTHYGPGATALAVNHQGLFVAATLSFNIRPGKSLSDADAAIREATREIHMPPSIHGTFAGTAKVFSQSTNDQPMLILAALIAVYIVLGMLYESFIHPVTILSTLPSAGVGAVLALILFNTEFTIIALIGVILLIGIVKKNAIMMIDFALEAERREGLTPEAAIFKACLLRFRPIMMTTVAALLGALPLALSFGNGAELRRPLGISIVGGLIVSQILTLYTTPIVYLGLERLRQRLSRAGVLIAGLLLTGCAVGPDYHRPDAPTPTAFKELEGWKPTEPEDGIDRGAWWSIYGDDELDALERRIALSNQNVKVYEAQYRQALALVREAQAQLFPTLGLTAGAQRGGGGGGSVSIASATGSAAGGRDANQFKLEATASWAPDIWGSIRRQIESQKAAAQVSKADLANALLDAQAQLATDYFDLRAADSLNELLTAAVAGYQRTLDITKAQYEAGMAAKSDVMTAEAQLQATRTQLIAVRQQRGQYEHAIAMLTGQPPADLSIPATRLTAHVPVVPTGLPSTLLERNPQVAAAERQMQSENALIGVAKAAFFPDLTLTGLFGYAGNPLSSLINVGNRVWSGGASATQLLFDAGQHNAALNAARAVYDQSVASYRQTVLTTFQQTEDELLALHVLQDESDSASAAVHDAQQATDIALAEYQAGTVAYTSVVTAQQALIADQQTALTIQQNRLIASVTLIEVLGGGWDASQLKL